MKLLLTVLMAALALTAFGQGVAVRSTNGVSSGQTRAGAETNVFPFSVSGTEVRTNYTTGSAGTYSASGLLFSTNGATTVSLNGPNGSVSALVGYFSSIAISNGVLTTNASTLNSGRVQVGDGGRGIANATASGSVPIDADGTATTLSQLQTLGVTGTNDSRAVNLANAGNTFGGTFTGNGTALTNINGKNVLYPTNASSVATINMALRYSAISTNNNIVFTGYTGIDASGTNCDPVTIIITNSAGSASVKTIAMPTGSFDLLNTGLTLYNTNAGVLTVLIYPNMGTNFSWIGK